MGRMFDMSAGFGPAIVTADEVGDIYQQTIETRIDGKVVESLAISNMRQTIEEIITYISSGVTLFPGDILCIGIPNGDQAKPERFMQPNEEMEISISNVGTLFNRINDEPSTPRTVGCC